MGWDGCGIRTGDTKLGFQGSDDFLRFAHAADADGAASLPAGAGADELDAIIKNLFGITLGGGVVPHGFVHGGGDEDALGVGGDKQGADKIVGETVRHFCEHVGRAGSDEDEVGLLGEADVLRVFTVDMVPKVGVDRLGGEGLEGGGADKVLGFSRHGDVDHGPGLREA